MNDGDFDTGNPDNVGYYPGQKPPDIPYVGEGKVVVERHTDYSSLARGANYPFDEDIDYDPRIDNVDYEEDEND